MGGELRQLLCGQEWLGSVRLLGLVVVQEGDRVGEGLQRVGVEEFLERVGIVGVVLGVLTAVVVDGGSGSRGLREGQVGCLGCVPQVEIFLPEEGFVQFGKRGEGAVELFGLLEEVLQEQCTVLMIQVHIKL